MERGARKHLSYKMHGQAFKGTVNLARNHPYVRIDTV